MIRVVESNDYMNNVHITTVDEFMEGFIDNMSDGQMTEEIRHINKILNKLRCVSYSSCYVVIDYDLYYNPTYIERKDDIRVDIIASLTECYGIKMIYEVKDGMGYYYFRSEDDAKNYVKSYEETEHNY